MGRGTAGAGQKLWMVPNQASPNDCNYPSTFSSEHTVKGGKMSANLFRMTGCREIHSAEDHPVRWRLNEVSKAAELSSKCKWLSSLETDHGPSKKDSQPKTHYCTVYCNVPSTSFSGVVNHNHWVSISVSLCFKLSFIAVQSKCQT